MREGVADSLIPLSELAGSHGVSILALGIALLVAYVVVLAIARKLLRNRPTDIDTRVAELVERGEYAEAGELWFEQGHHNRALALFLQSGNVQKSADCYLALKQPRRAAQLYAEAGRWAEAAHHFQTAAAWREAAECLHEIGNEQQAAEMYERGGELAKAANLLRALGDHETAARLFERAGLGAEAAASLLRAEGKSPATLRRAGELFDRAGETGRAAECFASAGDWLRAAELFEETRGYSLAAQAYERARCWDRAASAYERCGALHEARANYERAGDATRAAQVAVRLGSLLDAARGFYRIGSYERAIETLQSIAPGAPQATEAQALLARIFTEKGLLHRALDCLEPILPETPDSKTDAELWLLAADIHERAGNLKQAAEVLEGVLASHPDYEDAEERLDRILSRGRGDPGGLETVRDFRYELRGEIGRGGMGIVYLAHDRELGRPVAVKFLPEALAENPAALEMFKHEARASGVMNHPNIVHIYDTGSIAGRHCIVMEYVPGRTVRELMKVKGTKTKRPLPAQRVAAIAEVIASALDYAHERNVIHRDVKPANILISETEQPKLMDFGISKVLEAGGEGQTRAKGTPQYMPPEQILGRPIDRRADVYALGISMFEMLTGRRPFVGEDVVDQQLHRPLPDPRTLRPELPPALIRIVQRACEKEAGRRYATAGEMARALRRFLDGATEDEPPPDAAPSSS